MSFDVVDTQVHLTRELGREQILHSLDALGITSVVIDEFWGVTPELRVMPGDLLSSGLTRPLSPTAQAMAFESPDRVSYLQRVERQDPLLREVISLLGASDGCRGIRAMLLNRDERAAFADGRYDEIFTLAVQNDLAVCVLAPDVSTLPEVALRFPELRIVLDHCGWARHAAHWQEILDVARLSQVSLKWSHAARAFGDEATIAREFLRALDAFGVERVLWASDVTQDERSWHDLLAFVTHHPTLSHADKQWVLGRSAREVFRWPVSSPREEI